MFLFFVYALFSSVWLHAFGAFMSIIDKGDEYVDAGEGKSVHWVFSSDCSAYQFNQGNMLLASALHVKQGGNFTWVVVGCKHDDQKKALADHLVHPRAQVWHYTEVALKNPKTGQPYPPFQASNRPQAIYAWYKTVKPTEESIAIVDPDMFFMRAVKFVDHPKADSGAGPWEALAASPKHGTGAMYGEGCAVSIWPEADVRSICSDNVDNCMKHRKSDKCYETYSSGPPWVLHESDAQTVLGSWMDTAINVHNAHPGLLAEQYSYGVSQMIAGVGNTLDRFWFLSDTEDTAQPWSAVDNLAWDPCRSREPPPADMNLPPLWHTCSTYHVAHAGIALHKDHIHKDILDCDAPLLKYVDRDALDRYKADKPSTAALVEQNATAEKERKFQFRETWAVCAYTNLVNFHAKQVKEKSCKKPNLEATFAFPDHAQAFLNPNSWAAKTFRGGGWQDVDYKTG